MPLSLSLLPIVGTRQREVAGSQPASGPSPATCMSSTSGVRLCGRSTAQLCSTTHAAITRDAFCGEYLQHLIVGTRQREVAGSQPASGPSPATCMSSTSGVRLCGRSTAQLCSTTHAAITRDAFCGEYLQHLI